MNRTTYYRYSRALKEIADYSLSLESAQATAIDALKKRTRPKKFKGCEVDGCKHPRTGGSHRCEIHAKEWRDVKHKKRVERALLALVMREAGKTFREIGVALGNVSPTRATHIYSRGHRIRQRQRQVEHGT
jgi:hypothetical protein